MSKISIPCWAVKEVIPNNNYTLFLTFADGTQKIYDCKHLLDKGVFRALKDPVFFNKAHVFFDTVAWDDKIDIAPEELYYNSKPIE